MMLDEETEALFRRAEKQPLCADPPEATVLDRAGVEERLPQRDLLLLVDRVRLWRGGTIVAGYDLARAAEVFRGHFPGRPLFPGVLQIEAIGQAGVLLHLLESPERIEAVTLTHVRAARFLRPVEPGAELVLMARVIEDGLFFTVVGQCLQRGAICSAAAVSGLL
jgi:3-hydroxymyristoyl/3-hydroxydecanoyl-(acyl carrier protein) dehydratase